MRRASKSLRLARRYRHSVQLRSVFLCNYRSVDSVEFEASNFTVLFGKNNVGKTNILEGLYSLFAPHDSRVIRTAAYSAAGPEIATGSIEVQLEPEVDVDEWLARGLLTADAALQDVPRLGFNGSGPFVSGHDFGEIDTALDWNIHVLFLDWQFKDLHERVEESIGQLVSERAVLDVYDWPWLQAERGALNRRTWSIHPAAESLADQLGSLVTDLLPDFVDGSIKAQVNDPTRWGCAPKVELTFAPHGSPFSPGRVDSAGEGMARWISAAVQIALHLMSEHPNLLTLRDSGPKKAFSGHLLLIDEPEAHLHPSAVQSIVRWCQRMVDHGFIVMVSSHHEEFLRAASPEVTMVHVAPDPDMPSTRARTVPTAATSRLLELAQDVGMHPAAALSLHRAILFVEGPLDEAVLDEYGGLRLDAAGVKIIPIHGTKNLEGLIAVEVVSELGIKMGVLTDATDPLTMAERSGNKRSSEERKLMKVLAMAQEKGLPAPRIFGVPEDDLLFVLPPEALRAYLKGPFPGWNELRQECRVALSKGPSDSVDWKKFAKEKYNLPITDPAGVRHIVRTLDLGNVDLPSVRRVIDEVVEWATA